MLDHIGVPVSDLTLSRTCYARALAPLGAGVVMESNDAVGFGKAGKPQFWIGTSIMPLSPVHVAFTATRAEVDAFYAAAMQAGGRDNGPPGLRPHYHPSYYAAFVLDPDGHNVEAVCHAPQN
jgi:catechol 2,3-dioxygenase-like lactoylglutathione lyase family enzyme